MNRFLLLVPLAAFAAHAGAAPCDPACDPKKKQKAQAVAVCGSPAAQAAARAHVCGAKSAGTPTVVLREDAPGARGADAAAVAITTGPGGVELRSGNSVLRANGVRLATQQGGLLELAESVRGRLPQAGIEFEPRDVEVHIDVQGDLDDLDALEEIEIEGVDLSDLQDHVREALAEAREAQREARREAREAEREALEHVREAESQARERAAEARATIQDRLREAHKVWQEASERDPRTKQQAFRALQDAQKALAEVEWTKTAFRPRFLEQLSEESTPRLGVLARGQDAGLEDRVRALEERMREQGKAVEPGASLEERVAALERALSGGTAKSKSKAKGPLVYSTDGGWLAVVPEAEAPAAPEPPQPTPKARRGSGRAVAPAPSAPYVLHGLPPGAPTAKAPAVLRVAPVPPVPSVPPVPPVPGVRAVPAVPSVRGFAGAPRSDDAAREAIEEGLRALRAEAEALRREMMRMREEIERLPRRDR